MSHPDRRLCLVLLAAVLILALAACSPGHGPDDPLTTLTTCTKYDAGGQVAGVKILRGDTCRQCPSGYSRVHCGLGYAQP